MKKRLTEILGGEDKGKENTGLSGWLNTLTVAVVGTAGTNDRDLLAIEDARKVLQQVTGQNLSSEQQFTLIKCFMGSKSGYEHPMISYKGDAFEKLKSILSVLYQGGNLTWGQESRGVFVEDSRDKLVEMLFAMSQENYLNEKSFAEVMNADDPVNAAQEIIKIERQKKRERRVPPPTSAPLPPVEVVSTVEKEPKKSSDLKGDDKGAAVEKMLAEIVEKIGKIEALKISDTAKEIKVFKRQISEIKKLIKGGRLPEKLFSAVNQINLNLVEVEMKAQKAMEKSSLPDAKVVEIEGAKVPGSSRVAPKKGPITQLVSDGSELMNKQNNIMLMKLTDYEELREKIDGWKKEYNQWSDKHVHSLQSKEGKNITSILEGRLNELEQELRKVMASKLREKASELTSEYLSENAVEKGNAEEKPDRSSVHVQRESELSEMEESSEMPLPPTPRDSMSTSEEDDSLHSLPPTPRESSDNLPDDLDSELRDLLEGTPSLPKKKGPEIVPNPKLVRDAQIKIAPLLTSLEKDHMLESDLKEQFKTALIALMKHSHSLGVDSRGLASQIESLSAGIEKERQHVLNQMYSSLNNKFDHIIDIEDVKNLKIRGEPISQEAMYRELKELQVKEKELRSLPLESERLSGRDHSDVEHESVGSKEDLRGQIEALLVDNDSDAARAAKKDIEGSLHIDDKQLLKTRDNVAKDLLVKNDVVTQANRLLIESENLVRRKKGPEYEYYHDSLVRKLEILRKKVDVLGKIEAHKAKAAEALNVIGQIDQEVEGQEDARKSGIEKLKAFLRNRKSPVSSQAHSASVVGRKNELDYGADATKKAAARSPRPVIGLVAKRQRGADQEAGSNVTPAATSSKTSATKAKK